MIINRTGVFAFALACACAPATAHAIDDQALDHQALGRELLEELIETDTTTAHGSVTRASEALAQRFRTAGFPDADVQVVGAHPDRKNLVVRLRGEGKRKPVLLLAHLDVVEAKREDWSTDPFELVEKDGYFYGRGTLDIKGGAAGLATTLLRMHDEKIVPRGDYILALTAGEEDGIDNGVEWLLAQEPELIDAEVCFNVDAGGGEIHDGRRTNLSVQTAEKVFVSYTLTARNPGGHSSLPRADNAIYRLVAALQRLGAHAFPLRTNPTTRYYFEHLAASAEPALGDDLRAAAAADADTAQLGKLAAHSTFFNAMLRTTCTPTLLAAGHAENALPQMAQATINCRVLPGEDPAQVQAALVSALADSEIAVAEILPPTPSPASPVDATLLEAIAAAGEPIWGRLAAIPYMETGATDGLYLRRAGIPVYGFNGIFYDVDDVRAHGRDERILVKSYQENLEFTYNLLKAW